jgi:predicted 3-demethylubiquinone-9 3-methyltransferase (glyoxalase superfamily)
MQKINACLWFVDQAEEAAGYYTGIFPNSKITDVQRNGPSGPGPEGTALVVQFELDGQVFTALNGGPAEFSFTEAVSFMVSCADQAEVDALWSALTANGGEPGPCGWLKDRYGVSWQIVPTALPRLLSDPDPERAGRVLKAMMAMQKIEIAELEAAAAG